MAKTPHKTPAQQSTKPQKAVPRAPQGWDARLDRHFTRIVLAVVGLAAVLGLTLFDLRIGVGGDDSEYIKRAYDLVHDGQYPSFQGPLYPMVLAAFIWLFGLNIPLLKFLSFGFLLLGYGWWVSAFRGRVATGVLLLWGLAMASSPLFLFYGSQTYSEAFFFMLLAGAMRSSFTSFTLGDDAFPERSTWPKFLFMTLWLWALVLTKTVAYGLLIGLIGYWLVRRRWRWAVSIGALFVALQGLWWLFKRLVWQADKLQFSDQAATLLLRNPYAPSEGQEELWGFVLRFWSNSGIYLSKHFFAYFGLRQITDPTLDVLVVLMYLLLVGATLLAWRRSPHLLMVAAGILSMLGLSFVVLQPIWDSQRLIMPFVPYIGLLIFGALAGAMPTAYQRHGQWVAYGLLSVFFVASIRQALADSKLDRTDLKSYFAGNKLKGYTPDWVNYIRMSQWAAENVSDTVTIACRKPAISFLHTGRKFHGIFRIPMHDEQDFFDSLQQTAKPFVVLDEQRLMALNLPPNDLVPWKRNLAAFVGGTLGQSDTAQSRFYGVYVLDTPQAQHFAEGLRAGGVVFENSDSLRQALKPYDATIMVIKPDELRDELRQRNVHYVLMANLRKYEAQKTPYTINTIQRYLFYLQHKYPYVLEQVSETGFDEKAFLFKLHYEYAQ